MAAVTSFLIYTILLLAKWYLIFFKKKLKSTILKKVTPPPLKMTNNRGKAKQTKQNDISLAIIDGDVVLFLNVA